MAIAPSKLGQFVALHWSGDDSLLLNLRALGLMIPDAPDDEVTAAFRRAREEDEAMSEDARLFNSPEERVRVFLQPYVTDKGRTRACPATLWTCRTNSPP